jgi:hypothetical protein
LIKETESPAILFDSSFSSTVTELTDVNEVVAVEVPGLAALLTNNSSMMEYPYLDTFENVSDKPLVVSIVFLVQAQHNL